MLRISIWNAPLFGAVILCHAASASAQESGPRAAPAGAQARITADQATTDSLARIGDAARLGRLESVGGGLDGLFSLNQDVGDLNAQANIVAGAVAEGVHQRAGVTSRQALARNRLERGAGSETLSLRDSFDFGAGVAQVNQAAGAFNQQLNALAFAFAEARGAPITAVSDVELARVREANTLLQEGPPGARTVESVGNFDGFTGAAQVNQTVGAFNQVSNVIVFNRLGGGG